MKKSLLLVLFSLFVTMIGFGLTLPALPFFVERLALGPEATQREIAFHVGGLTSAFALTQLGFSPLWGLLSDARGRKLVLVIGMVGFSVSQLVFGLSSSLFLLYSARLGGGVFASAVLTMSSTYVADVLPPETRGKGMAWRGSAAGLGVVMGPMLSGLLAGEDWHIRSRVVGHLMFDGFSIPFFAAAAIAAVTVPLIVRWLPEFSPQLESKHALHRDRRWYQLGLHLKGLLGLVLASQFGLALFEAVFALFAAQKLRLSMTQIGYGFAMCGLVMAIFQGSVVGYLSGRISERVQIAAGFVLTGAGLLLLLGAESVVNTLGIIAVLAFGISLISPNVITLIANHSESNEGVAMGLQNAVASLGQVTGPLVGGVLFGLSAVLPFTLAGVLMLILAIFTARWRMDQVFSEPGIWTPYLKKK